MKKLFCLLLICAFSIFVYAYEYTLTEHSKIKELSSFTIMGEIDLRPSKDIHSDVKYRTLNHEGGMKLTVLEILGNDKQEKNGLWLYVILNAPMWVESGEWILSGQKFLIFLPDDMPVFDFEE